MTDIHLNALGPLMNQLGQMLADVADGDPEGVFLYVEIAEGWVSASVFKDDGKTIRYLDTEEPDFSNLLFDIWYAAPRDKRWSVMEYDIKDGRFEVSFKYPDEVNVEVAFDGDRREDALRARYGDRPVIYPPPPYGAFELKP
ncbi:MAG: hypothetical protein EON93_07170 [Burkholderiales bacterium]|nr:MAG: hypothetical protein EON93_07170 [Burkholderiales bacterium]